MNCCDSEEYLFKILFFYCWHWYPIWFQDERFEVSKFDYMMEIGAPSTKIYHFTGTIPLPSGERVPLTKDNLLLRDCALRNTDYIEGIVVYAGKFDCQVFKMHYTLYILFCNFFFTLSVKWRTFLMYTISQDVRQKLCWIMVAQGTSVPSLSAGWTLRSSGVWSSCSSCASSLQQDRVCGRYVQTSNLGTRFNWVFSSIHYCIMEEKIIWYSSAVCLFYLFTF